MQAVAGASRPSGARGIGPVIASGLRAVAGPVLGDRSDAALPGVDVAMAGPTSTSAAWQHSPTYQRASS
ncbi:hypothetical protein [Sorangium sp. So ce406]|uniref:hypothetical protein n=1 Tax=Sorangium sp. So ce406 TaxID=3133311 RepID=UPI003F5B81FD